MPEKASQQVRNNRGALRGLPLQAPWDWSGARGFPTALALGHIIRKLEQAKKWSTDTSYAQCTATTHCPCSREAGEWVRNQREKDSFESVQELIR